MSRQRGRYGNALPLDEPPWIIDSAVPHAITCVRDNAGSCTFKLRSRLHGNLVVLIYTAYYVPAAAIVTGALLLWILDWLTYLYPQTNWSAIGVNGFFLLLFVLVILQWIALVRLIQRAQRKRRLTFYHITIAPGAEIATVVVEDPYGNSLPFDEIPVDGGFLRLRCKVRESKHDWHVFVAFGHHCRYLLACHREREKFEQMMRELPEGVRKVARPMEDRLDYVVPAWAALVERLSP